MREDVKRKEMQKYSLGLYKDFSWRSDVSIAFACKGLEYEVSVTFRGRNDNIFSTNESKKKFSFSSADSARKIEFIINQIYNYDTVRK